MTVFVQYVDCDNSCGDPDCCGGPSPSPTVRLFSSRAAATAAGLTTREVEDLTEVTVDNNEFEYVG